MASFLSLCIVLSLFHFHLAFYYPTLREEEEEGQAPSPLPPSPLPPSPFPLPAFLLPPSPTHPPFKYGVPCLLDSPLFHSEPFCNLTPFPLPPSHLPAFPLPPPTPYLQVRSSSSSQLPPVPFWSFLWPHSLPPSCIRTLSGPCPVLWTPVSSLKLKFTTSTKSSTTGELHVLQEFGVACCYWFHACRLLVLRLVYGVGMERVADEHWGEGVKGAGGRGGDKEEGEKKQGREGWGMEGGNEERMER